MWLVITDHAYCTGVTVKSPHWLLISLFVSRTSALSQGLSNEARHLACPSCIGHWSSSGRRLQYKILSKPTSHCPSIIRSQSGHTPGLSVSYIHVHWPANCATSHRHRWGGGFNCSRDHPCCVKPLWRPVPWQRRQITSLFTQQDDVLQMTTCARNMTADWGLRHTHAKQKAFITKTL